MLISWTCLTLTLYGEHFWYRITGSNRLALYYKWVYHPYSHYYDLIPQLLGSIAILIGLVFLDRRHTWNWLTLGSAVWLISIALDILQYSGLVDFEKWLPRSTNYLLTNFARQLLLAAIPYFILTFFLNRRTFDAERIAVRSMLILLIISFVFESVKLSQIVLPLHRVGTLMLTSAKLLSIPFLVIAFVRFMTRSGARYLFVGSVFLLLGYVGLFAEYAIQEIGSGNGGSSGMYRPLSELNLELMATIPAILSLIVAHRMLRENPRIAKVT